MVLGWHLVGLGGLRGRGSAEMDGDLVRIDGIRWAVTVGVTVLARLPRQTWSAMGADFGMDYRRGFQLFRCNDPENRSFWK